MIRRVPLEGMPWDVIEASRDPFEGFWADIFENTVSMSKIKFRCYDGRTPLMALGAAQKNLLVNEAEVWCVVTKYLQVKHLPELRRLYQEYFSDYTGPRLVAGVNSGLSRDVKFLRFFGALPLPDRDHIKLFEVHP